MKKIKQMMVPAFLISLFVPVYASAESDDFRDVEEDYWAADEINYLADKEIVSGYDDGSFHPGETVIRSQAASMLVKALDLEIENRTNPDFSDVSEDFHAYDVAAAVWDEEIISGRNGAFMPNDALTRGQMAAVLNRAFKFGDNENKSEYFSDIDQDYALYNDVQMIAQMGITTGYSDGSYKPNNDVTRAQFAVFLARALDQDQFVNPNHTTYTNNRFGFEVTYPDNWEDGEEADNGDGKTLLDDNNSTIRAYGTHYKENQAPDVDDYEEVTLDNGKTAYYHTTQSDNKIAFDLYRVTEETEYHVNGEVTKAFYSENANDIRDTLYSLVTRN
ncbi:hypothetical protein J2S78_001348 [Salibacterium salarium]|uniref:S-layer homology domain-containing protein n=1 Tax=Salibacterium salarium TaxID=284579 RepID=UPI002783959C|nr:S-layer homology domain-containing protein [Salibacterium salarium]MDQ0298928.1 hypothetical protein [Salibacterium salarium]